MSIEQEPTFAEPFLTAYSNLPDFEFAEVREIIDSWFRSCKGSEIPSLADFDLTDFPKLLPHLTLVESYDNGPQKFRYAGRRIVETFGREITGMAYSELVGDAAAAEAYAKFHFVTKQPCGRSVSLITRRASGIASAVQVLMLPLKTGRADHSCILCLAVEREDWVAVDIEIAEDFIEHEHDQYFDIGFGKPDEK